MAAEPELTDFIDNEHCFSVRNDTENAVLIGKREKDVRLSALIIPAENMKGFTIQEQAGVPYLYARSVDNGALWTPCVGRIRNIEQARAWVQKVNEFYQTA